MYFASGVPSPLGEGRWFYLQTTQATTEGEERGGGKGKRESHSLSRHGGPRWFCRWMCSTRVDDEDDVNRWIHCHSAKLTLSKLMWSLASSRKAEVHECEATEAERRAVARKQLAVRVCVRGERREMQLKPWTQWVGCCSCKQQAAVAPLPTNERSQVNIRLFFSPLWLIKRKHRETNERGSPSSYPLICDERHNNYSLLCDRVLL